MKRKIKYVGITILFVLLLTGCTGGAKKDFLKFQKENNVKDEIAYDVNFKVKELELRKSKNEKEKLVQSMVEIPIKESELSGVVQVQKKGKSVHTLMDMEADVMGTKLPVEIVSTSGAQPKTYVSMRTMNVLLQLFSRWMDNDIESTELEKITEDYSRKYLDVNEWTNELPKQADKTSKKQKSKGTVDSSEEKLDVAKGLVQLDKKMFTKSEDVVTLTITKDDLLEKLENTKIENKKEIKNQLKIFKKYEIKYSVNLKNKKQIVSVEVQPDNEKETDPVLEKMTLQMQLKETKRRSKVVLPKEKDIITKEFILEKLLESKEQNNTPNIDTFMKEMEQKKEEKESRKKSNIPDLSKFKPIAETNEIVSFETDGNLTTAEVPDYYQYTKEHVLEMLGEPVEVISDPLQLQTFIQEREIEKIVAEVKSGRLTENQARAFSMQAVDVSMGGEVEILVYDGKPNVFILDGEVGYVTPIKEYMEFNGQL